MVISIARFSEKPLTSVRASTLKIVLNMSSFELNKWLGAFLATGVLVMVLNIFVDALFRTHQNEEVPIFLVENTLVADHKPPVQVKKTASLDVLLLSADQNAGKKTAKKCLPCHTFDPDGADKIGPNLWNVLGRAKAGRPGFAYSTNLTGIGGAWDYDALNDFLTSPKVYAPGTKMSFPGLKKPAARANIIVYLRTLSDAPIALPVE